MEQTLRLPGQTCLDDVCVDAGYQGHRCGALAQVHVVKRRRRRLSRSVRHWYRRRSRIEPIIGQRQQDHRLRRNPLKGVEGAKMNVIRADCGFNLRKRLRTVLLALWQLLAARRCDTLPSWPHLERRKTSFFRADHLRGSVCPSSQTHHPHDHDRRTSTIRPTVLSTPITHHRSCTIPALHI